MSAEKMLETAKPSPASKVIRAKDFAKRLEIACENHQRAPSGHGRQKWVRDQILDRYSIELSPEAVRKWFAGESRPKPAMMKMVADVLDVSEAWLSLGLTPSATPIEQKKLNAMAVGAVNVVAGQLQLAGATIAFPEDDGGPDLFVILRGKQVALTIRLGSPEAKFKLDAPLGASTLIIVIPTDKGTIQRFFTVSKEQIEQHGKLRGSYVEFEIERQGSHFTIGGNTLPEIRSFIDINGSAPKRDAQREAARKALDLP